MLALVLAAARLPVARRTLARVARRWTEIHTPGAGRDRILDPRVLGIAAKLGEQGIRTYRLTSRLGGSIGLAHYIVEAAWPIECREQDTNVVGYVSDFRERADCAVVASAGELAIAHCPL